MVGPIHTAAPELLAPAGNLDKLKVAFRYGANAVYASGQRFGLRASADNFSLTEFEEGVRFAHQLGGKVYVTLNAFLHDDELDDLPSYVSALEEIGVDAAIISDLGTLAVVRETTKLPIHLSTQASSLNAGSAQVWKELGVRRIILGRECSVASAGNIARSAGVAVELFIHGALCMAFSGRCTISNYTAGRDANRGGCIQSCRFPYELSTETESVQTHFMSSKDLYGLELVPDFFEHSICSAKIEGRMKSLLYVATVTRAYRRAFDMYLSGASLPRIVSKLEHELNAFPHRDYTEGSLVDPAGADSTYYSNRAPNDNSSHEMIGIVRDQSERGPVVQLFQPVAVGDQLELLLPDGSNQPIVVDRLYLPLDQEITSSRQDAVVCLPCPVQAESYSMIRAVRSTTSKQEVSAC